MKQKFSLVILYLITCTLAAQTLKSDGYTISLNNIESESGTMTILETTYDYKQYTGMYTIEKGGAEIVQQSFSTLQLKKNAVSVNIKNKRGYGNTVSYDYDTKKMEYQYKKFKIKKPKNINDIILNAILIYVKAD